jgi:hypothetical protein
MPRAARLLLPLLLALGACHTDPFSVKPEVPGVRIPDKPAEPAEPEDETPDAQP